MWLLPMLYRSAVPLPEAIIGCNNHSPFPSPANMLSISSRVLPFVSGTVK